MNTRLSWPVANSDLLEVGRPEAGDVDQARRERSFVRLKEAGVPYMEHLPCEVLDCEAMIRKPEEIACRAETLVCRGLVFRGDVIGKPGSGRGFRVCGPG